MLIALTPTHHYSRVRGTPWSAEDDIGGFVPHTAMYTISFLLENSLEELLDALQILLSARKRASWPVICFALSLLFLGAECLQATVYRLSSKARAMCEAMEMKSILILVELFKASTAGFNPLCLDWTKEKNAELVENDEAAFMSLKALQDLSHEYCESWTLECAWLLLTVWKGSS